MHMITAESGQVWLTCDHIKLRGSISIERLNDVPGVGKHIEVVLITSNAALGEKALLSSMLHGAK